jgi:hypothetical protein
MKGRSSLEVQLAHRENASTLDRQFHKALQAQQKRSKIGPVGEEHFFVDEHFLATTPGFSARQRTESITPSWLSL